MPKLVVMRGLPGSGKSTIAREMVKSDGNMLRVNRDELRRMLHPDLHWTKEREKRTVDAEKKIVVSALDKGVNVVVDDTNILGAGIDLWKTVLWDNCQQLSDSVFSVMDLTKTVPIEECIQRDRMRFGNECVGRGVIDRMALFGGIIDFSKEERVAVVDIDGTLANLDHRLKYIENQVRDYSAFFANVDLDDVYITVWNAVLELKRTGHTIIILSGRPTNVGHTTNEWLCGFEYQTEGHESIDPDYLFMRQAGDHRPDNQVKRQLMETMFLHGLNKEAIKVVLDDRDSVCAVWREMGLPLLQVNRGNIIQIEPSALRMAQMLQIPIDSGEMPSDQDKPTRAGV